MSAPMLRNWMRLFEDATMSLPPEVARYIAQNPEAVSHDKDALIADLVKHADTGARFAWAIGKLEDGRFISAFPKVLQKWGIQIVEQGTHEDI